jgi:hypothetical protein
LLGLLGLLLAGCASPPYVPPTSGPTAQLRFSQDHALVLFYEDASCKNPRMLGEERTIPVPAERPLFVSVQYGGALHSCKAFVSFVPAMSQSYLVEYFEPDNSHCTVSVERIGLSGAKMGQEKERQGFRC